MIRISKSNTIPSSLLVDSCNNCNGQDVQEILVADQHNKCYLCEQKTTKSFEIEHLKSKATGYFPELKYTWSNLFLSCSYCNGRKPNDFDLLDPLLNDIENVISHRLDLATGSISIKNSRVGVQDEHTAKLLERLFNGKNNLRDIKCEILFKDLKQEIVFFLSLLNDYKSTKAQRPNNG